MFTNILTIAALYVGLTSAMVLVIRGGRHRHSGRHGGGMPDTTSDEQIRRANEERKLVVKETEKDEKGNEMQKEDGYFIGVVAFSILWTALFGFRFFG